MVESLDTVFHLAIECHNAMQIRQKMWDSITDLLGVVLSVDLFNREESDVFDIMLGKPWQLLNERVLLDSFSCIICAAICNILQVLDL